MHVGDRAVFVPKRRETQAVSEAAGGRKERKSVHAGRRLGADDHNKTHGAILPLYCTFAAPQANRRDQTAMQRPSVEADIYHTKPRERKKNTVPSPPVPYAPRAKALAASRRSSDLRWSSTNAKYSVRRRVDGAERRPASPPPPEQPLPVKAAVAPVSRRQLLQRRRAAVAKEASSLSQVFHRNQRGERKLAVNRA